LSRQNEKRRQLYIPDHGSCRQSHTDYGGSNHYQHAHDERVQHCRHFLCRADQHPGDSRCGRGLPYHVHHPGRRFLLRPGFRNLHLAQARLQGDRARQPDGVDIFLPVLPVRTGFGGGRMDLPRATFSGTRIDPDHPPVHEEIPRCDLDRHSVHDKRADAEQPDQIPGQRVIFDVRNHQRCGAQCDHGPAVRFRLQVRYYGSGDRYRHRSDRKLRRTLCDDLLRWYYQIAFQSDTP